MKLMNQARRFGSFVGRTVRKTYHAIIGGGVVGLGYANLASAQITDLSGVDVGSEMTSGAGRLAADIGIAVGIILVLAAIGAAVLWGRKALKSK